MTWAPPGCSLRPAVALGASENEGKKPISRCEDDEVGLRHLWKDPANIGSKSMA